MSKGTVTRIIFTAVLVFAFYLAVHAVLDSDWPGSRWLNKVWCQKTVSGTSIARYGVFEYGILAAVLGYAGTNKECFVRWYRWLGLLVLYSGLIILMNALVHMRFDHAGLMWWMPHGWRTLVLYPRPAIMTTTIVCAAAMYGHSTVFKRGKK